MRLVLPALLLLACSRPPVDPTVRVVLHEDGVENAYPRVLRDGTILYQSNRNGGVWQLYTLDPETRESRALTEHGNNNLPDVAQDGAQIAFVSDRDGNEEIYVMSRDGSNQRRLTTNPGRDIHPYFHPDGKTLLYNSQRARDSFDVYALDLTTSTERRLTATPEDETCARFSPDGSQLVLLRNDARGDDLFVLHPDGTSDRNVTQTPEVRDGWPVFSPDGKWIYYASQTMGAFSIYRTRTDGSQVERLTTPPPGHEDARPFVTGDGRLVFNRKHHKTIDIVERSI